MFVLAKSHEGPLGHCGLRPGSNLCGSESVVAEHAPGWFQAYIGL